jgi:hypothetical protein
LSGPGISERKGQRRAAAVDTSRLTQPEDGFPLLDLTARFAFETASSIVFDLGRMGNLRLDDAPEIESHGFKAVGWLDVHHPCDGYVRAQLRICLPAEYHPFEKSRREEAYISRSNCHPRRKNVHGMVAWGSTSPLRALICKPCREGVDMTYGVVRTGVDERDSGR